MIKNVSLVLISAKKEMEDMEAGDSAAAAAGEGARQAAQLDSITDHVEEKQLDAEKTKEAMAALSGRTKDADREREERQRELAKVRVVQADVDTLADEFEVCV